MHLHFTLDILRLDTYVPTFIHQIDVANEGMLALHVKSTFLFFTHFKILPFPYFVSIPKTCDSQSTKYHFFNFWVGWDGQHSSLHFKE